MGQETGIGLGGFNLRWLSSFQLGQQSSQNSTGAGGGSDAKLTLLLTIPYWLLVGGLSSLSHGHFHSAPSDMGACFPQSNERDRWTLRQRQKHRLFEVTMF